MTNEPNNKASEQLTKNAPSQLSATDGAYETAASTESQNGRAPLHEANEACAAGDVSKTRESFPSQTARAAAQSANPAGESAAPSPADERRIANKLAAVGVAGNIALSAFKLFAGIFGNSAAMVSDAVHSLSDVAATAIAFAGVRISQRAADEGHPYGHERFECLASMALGLILAATGAGIGFASVESIVTGAYKTAAAPGWLALCAALVSIVAKEGMFWYTRHWARVMNSDAFMADAWHHRSDALSSIGALVGIGGAMLGWGVCDPLASAVICLIIFKVAFEVLRDAVNKVTDTPCAPTFELEVRDCILAQPGVVRIDALRTRQFGSKVYVDAEIAVDGQLRLVDAHAIAEAAHDAVEHDFPTVKHIMIHENPA